MNKIHKNLLIIDDDIIFSEAISHHFSSDLNVFTVKSGNDGVRICSENRIDVVLLDQKLPDGSGSDFCIPILSENCNTKIIFITAFPSFSNALNAIKVGAHNYLSKPFELEELELAISNAIRTIALEQVEQIQGYKNQVESRETVLIGKSLHKTKLIQHVSLAAGNQSQVLITGETGTGKGVVAKTIHYQSQFKAGPFISVNCAAFPENLIEDELFGHEKGAFTGADSTRKGIFEMAEGGTLFLDEIGDLPLHLQSKILNVFDENQIRRLGGRTLIPVNEHIITATNVDIEQAMKEQRFRKDLYYRLSIMRIHLPPLRDRLDDLDELSEYFIRTISPDTPVTLPQSEINGMKNYSWPGNIRELRNVIERSIILRIGSTIYPTAFLAPQLSLKPASSGFNAVSSKVLTLRDMEKGYISETLKTMNHNRTHAARTLGISRSTLMRKIKEYQI